MHRNAPLTPEGRFRLCLLIEDGWTVAAAAESMRISRQTAHKWWSRYQQAGRAGLDDRSSRPRRCPTKTPDKVERRLVELRRRHQLGPARLAPRAGVPASALHAVWVRHGVSRLSDLERRAGRVVRRIETSHPGELVHIDIKKQWRWWRFTASGQDRRRRRPPRLCLRPFGHRRPLPPGVLGDPCQRTGRHRGGLLEAGSGLLRHLRHHRRKSDDGQRPCYRSGVFTDELVAAAIVHTRTKAYCPQTNGKMSATTGPAQRVGIRGLSGGDGERGRKEKGEMNRREWTDSNWLEE